MNGLKGRLTYEYQPQKAWLGFRFRRGIQYDNVRHPAGYLGLHLRLGLANKTQVKETPLVAHMTDLVSRDPDIILQSMLSSSQQTCQNKEFLQVRTDLNTPGALPTEKHQNDSAIKLVNLLINFAQSNDLTCMQELLDLGVHPSIEWYNAHGIPCTILEYSLSSDNVRIILCRRRKFGYGKQTQDR